MTGFRCWQCCSLFFHNIWPWRHARGIANLPFNRLHKKGDAAMPKKLSTDSDTSVLSKLFSGILLERMAADAGRSLLEERWTPKEMDFKWDYNCSDLIHMLRTIGEKSIEWMASIDLETAFDKLVHFRCGRRIGRSAS